MSYELDERARQLQNGYQQRTIEKKICFNVVVCSECGRKNSCLLNFPLPEAL